uniref:SCP domain-containing protein n=1 Tax=Hyaloperonospora arabidopsidis (strain Emoy2) TaxID=559515 RepID=M4B1A3_HYAAE
MSATFLHVLLVTLLGFPTAAAVQSIVEPIIIGADVVKNITVRVSIIGDALFEDISTASPILGKDTLNDVSGLTNPNSVRHLQTSYTSVDFRAGILNAVNAERVARNLPKLCMNLELQNAAQGHSNDMAVYNYMGHTGSDGSKMSGRIEAEGYHGVACGENVAAGQVSVEQVVKAWMASPPHRQNILRKKFTMLGCGYAYNDDSAYGRYWTQNFGTSMN